MKHPWQRKKRQRDHSDDWLMTYADMITLLLCFFVVFLLVSATAKKEENKATDAPPPAEIVQTETPPPVESPPPPQPETLPPKVIMGNLPFHDPQEEAEILADIHQEPAPPTAEKVESAPTSPIEEKKGDRLTTLEISSAAFFDVGSATMNESGKKILKEVADKIKSDAYKGYQVTVEGHTDDSPIKTLQFPSNWELSTARASSVVHCLLAEGIPPQRLRAAGYADTFPKLPNRDAAGNPIAQNQAQNRRVVIKLEKVE